MKQDELAKLINRKAALQVGNLVFAVKITDARSAYGRDDVLVVPVSGEGRQWVRLTSIEIEEG